MTAALLGCGPNVYGYQKELMKQFEEPSNRVFVMQGGRQHSKSLKTAAALEEAKKHAGPSGVIYFCEASEPYFDKDDQPVRQFRFPRSKKKRIRQKWAKRIENYRAWFDRPEDNLGT